ncbi:MAG: hypothetical protein ABIP94_05270 [Planctomycetota bacterium]
MKRLLDSLRNRPGITKAHVDTADATKPKLCLHYDPAAVRFEEVQSLVKSAGAELQARFEHLSVPVIGLRHERQAKLVEAVFANEPGVLRAAVAFGSRRLYVEFDPQRTSRVALLPIRAGIAVGQEVPAASPAATKKPEADEHAHGGLFGERTAHGASRSIS